jgi:hypothetical protein
MRVLTRLVGSDERLNGMIDGQEARRIAMGRGATYRTATLSLLLALVVSAATVFAADEGETASVTGEVLDTACYVAHGRKGAGPGHKKCASECIQKKDFPISILTEQEDVVLILPDHADERPYEELKGRAAETVTVEGRLITRGGLKALVLSGVK